VGLASRAVSQGEVWKRREASRAVFLNAARTQVGLIHWPHNGGYYLLPGGGIKSGETPDEAVLRETYEESGYTGEIVGRLGHVTERRTQSPFMQTSYAYVVVENGGDGVPRLEEKEERMGISFRWIAIDNLSAAMNLWPVLERGGADDRLLFAWWRDTRIIRAAGECGFLNKRRVYV
jgi:8-oxo-dGTP pyrophosphatase MutT (NUDIX family)